MTKTGEGSSTSTAAVSYDTVEGCSQVFIGGKWVEPRSEEMIGVEAPARRQIVATVVMASPEDIDRAVQAGRAAYPTWSATTVRERIGAIQRIRNGIEDRSERLARLIAIEVGTPVVAARRTHVGMSIEALDTFASSLERFMFEEQLGTSTILRHPLGVIGAITPWNFPLTQIIWKLGAALAAGCPVVVKPSELAPLTALELARAVEAADLPPGVVSILPGYGHSAGEHLVSHEGIDGITFTGSTAVGRRVGATALSRLARVTLELGGKSACVILDDADLEQAVRVAVRSCYGNAGQTCSAWTRLLVPAGVLEDASVIAAREANTMRLGDPLEESTNLGPVISATQFDRVQAYIESGIREGADAVAGGLGPPPGYENGYYVRPTVLTNVGRDMVVAREEIFGPVLVVMPYADDRDALAIANATRYGLSGAVWSADAERAQAFAREMRTGQVYVNGARYNPAAPFGGWGDSGIGREFGTYGIDEFIELQAIQN